MHPKTNQPLHRIENGYILWRKETPKIDLGIGNLIGGHMHWK